MIEHHDWATSDDVAAHYDDLDEYYRRIWGEHVHHGLWRHGDESSSQAVLQLVEEVAARAGVRSGGKVCDVGCGYGATARILAQQYGAQVTALSLSPRQLEYARRQPRDGITYLLRDWLKNDLPANSFDAVIAIESLAHMNDKYRFFAEAQRVLRPGGTLVVCAWLTREKPSKWDARVLLEPICKQGRLPGMGSASEYSHLAQTAGFRLENFEDVSRHVARTWTICLRRAAILALRDPKVRAFLLDARQENREFACTLALIRLAYFFGSMRYGIFAWQRS